MSTVGRLLRTLRLATRLTVDEAAVVSAMAPDRLRELETGRDLSYLEGLRIAKAYLLCPTCFRRHFEGAVERDMAFSVAIDPDLTAESRNPQPGDESLLVSPLLVGAIAASNEPIDTPYVRAITSASR